MTLWSNYVAWAERDMAETWPTMIGFSTIVPFLPLLINVVFAWVSVSEPIRLTVVGLTTLCFLVLFSAQVRAAMVVSKQRWQERQAERQDR